MQQVIGDQGLGMISAVKRYIDPTNIFASGNIIPDGTDTESPAQHVNLKAKL
jgi:hypothetical protein